MESHHVVYRYLYARIKLEVVKVRKGQKKRVWTSEQKSEIAHKHLDEHVSLRPLEKEYNADRSMIRRWVKEYIAEGESTFIAKRHPGNLFAALHVMKNLSELERLRLKSSLKLRMND